MLLVGGLLGIEVKARSSIFRSLASHHTLGIVGSIRRTKLKGQITLIIPGSPRRVISILLDLLGSVRIVLSCSKLL